MNEARALRLFVRQMGVPARPPRHVSPFLTLSNHSMPIRHRALKEEYRNA
jgi:hypothetical protein